MPFRRVRDELGETSRDRIVGGKSYLPPSKLLLKPRYQPRHSVVQGVRGEHR